MADCSPYHSGLDTPLLSFGGEKWTIRDAAEATAIWGAPGSGKSSGSAQAIARAFLDAGMGGMVLCAKNDEADTWRRYVHESGRDSDLVVVDASSAERFNILDYAARNLATRGFEHNLVELMSRMAEAARVASGKGGDDANRFFVDASMRWLSHAFPILLLAYGTLRMRDVDQMISSAPKGYRKDATGKTSLAWSPQSFCYRTLVIADTRIKDALKAGKKADYAKDILDQHGSFFTDEYPRMDNKTRSSVEATLSNLIYPFLSGKLSELFCTTSTFSPADCRNGKIILLDLPVLRYGPAGAIGQTMLKYLFGLVVQNVRVTDDTRPVFLFADEAQFFINTSDADLLSTARSSKTCIVYITQDLPTYYAKLGPDARDVAESIISKFGTRIFHANASRETNEYAANLIGKVEKFHVTQSRSKGRSTGSGGSRHDGGGGYSGHDGKNINEAESTTGYIDYEVPPETFATQLRTGSKRHKYRVDGIVVRTARTFNQTKRHWIKTEFRQQ